MKIRHSTPQGGWRSILAVMVVLASAFGNTASAQETATLKQFSSDKELLTFLQKFKKPVLPLTKADSGTTTLESAIVTGSLVPSITNNQTAGVDEGGIVKLHGDHLVVLRRGRLFSIAIGGGALRPVAWIDAFGPGMNPESAWYDEMLIYEDRIVVIGYSDSESGTEIGLFRIDTQGRLSYEATYHLRSNDYYSSRNYASRLVDGKLVFYTPLYVRGDMDDLPAIRKWREFARLTADDKQPDSGNRDSQDSFQRIASARRVYRPVHALSESEEPTLHTVTSCDLRRAKLKCEATVAIGPSGRTFYVSATAVYIWTGDEYQRGRDESRPGVLYRMPLDGTSPTALQVAGMPIDQFSFLESGGHLNVLVKSDRGGEAMWRAEVASGDLALLRITLNDFGSGSRRIRWSDYRALARESEDGCSLQNRFVGERLLYGCGDSWGLPKGKRSALHVVQLAWNQAAQLALPHGVDRIEALGSNAVVIGADSEQSLHFSGINLDAAPTVVQRFAIEKAAQGELRSHGFFYKANTDGGVLGLPIRGPGAAGYKHLFEDSAAIIFVQNKANEFQELGRLGAGTDNLDDAADACRASCVDWYGNARPIFLRERVFALLGYDMVEGAIRGSKLSESKRITFAPAVSH